MALLRPPRPSDASQGFGDLILLVLWPRPPEALQDRLPREWDLVVPGDDAELVAEFRRHGVKPGQRLHVAVVDRNGSDTAAEQELPSFFASFDGPVDLAERSSEILRSEFPGA